VLTLAGCGGGGDGGTESQQREPSAEAGAIAAVPAAGFFQLPPGLYERTVRRMGEPTIVDRVCIDPSVHNRIVPVTELRGIREGCTIVEQHPPSPFGVTFTLQCERPQLGTVGGNMRLDEGVLKTDLTFNDAANQTSGGAETRRIGDCPAGMRPGDVLDQSGRVTGSIRG